jgi:uncharacterized membrane protein SpoIIM required for sporulation
MVILSIPPHVEDGTKLAAGIAAGLLALGTATFGIVAFVGFSIGILCVGVSPKIAEQ